MFEIFHKKKYLAFTIILLLSFAIFAVYTRKELIMKSQKIPAIATTHSFVTSSNKWYSSIYKSFPTSPLYAMPGVFQITPNGLAFSLPKVVKTPNTIFFSFQEDFTVGFSDSLSAPAITSIGDWNIGVSMKNTRNHTLSFTLSHGVPFVVLHSQQESIQFMFKSNPTIFLNGKTQLVNEQTQNAQSLLLEINSNAYTIVFDTPVPITQSGTTIKVGVPQRIFIGIMDTKDHFDIFSQHAKAEVTTTVANPTETSSQLQTQYQFTSVETPLIVLYPHQYDNLQSQIPVLGTYQTLRGSMQLASANTFTTVTTLRVPDPFFQVPRTISNEFLTTLNSDITTLVNTPPPTSKDYYLGTWFGKATSLMLLAKMAHVPNQQLALQQLLETRLSESMSYFSYDKSKMSVIANYPEFGNEQLNDHHFHYGYYIRTAAILSLLDPSFYVKVKPQIDAMVSDIANDNRSSQKFPYLRNFDPYENHSWADGYGDTADGNNQESSSEAINAWYGVYLWGKASNNQTLQNIGLYLYNSEVQGATYYWFGKNGMYTPPYNHAITSLVFGGKVDFATWFSANSNMKYGIELLPFTPASTYLGTFSKFSQYQKDYVASGGDIKNDWGDLFTMWQSFYDPTSALKEKDNVTKFEGDNPKSLFLYFLLINTP